MSTDIKFDDTVQAFERVVDLMRDDGVDINAILVYLLIVQGGGRISDAETIRRANRFVEEYGEPTLESIKQFIQDNAFSFENAVSLLRSARAQ